MFSDRIDAGKQLAEELSFLKDQDTVVLGVPRGGLIVANEVAKELDAPLDIVIPRKIGAPNNPEIAIGAVTEDGEPLWRNDIITFLGVHSDVLDNMAQREIEEIRRRTKVYRGVNPRVQLEGRNVALIDDGIATGFTIMAAIKSLRRAGVKKLILGVPVGPEDTLKTFEDVADEVVSIISPEDFRAVGQFYEDFGQTTDEEVIELLAKAKR